MCLTVVCQDKKTSVTRLWGLIFLSIGGESASRYRKRGLQRITRWFDAEAQVPLISGYCLSALLASPGALCHIQLSILVTRLWSLKKAFFGTTPLLFSMPLELSFADGIAWGHNSASNTERTLNPHAPSIAAFAPTPLCNNVSTFSLFHFLI